MADRPIAFSAPMIAALEAGRKFQTRRILKPQPVEQPTGSLLRECRPHIHLKAENAAALVKEWPGDLPFKVRDRLWVREAYWQWGRWMLLPDEVTKGGRDKWQFEGDKHRVIFEEPRAYMLGRRASNLGVEGWHKRLGRFMPRAYSRRTLVVSDVHVHRLQDISEQDARAEGIEPVPGGWRSYEAYPDGTPHPHSIVPNLYAKRSFMELWNSLHGADAWALNPWVIAIGFTQENGGGNNGG